MVTSPGWCSVDAVSVPRRAQVTRRLGQEALCGRQRRWRVCAAELASRGRAGRKRRGAALPASACARAGSRCRGSVSSGMRASGCWCARALRHGREQRGQMGAWCGGARGQGACRAGAGRERGRRARWRAAQQRSRGGERGGALCGQAARGVHGREQGERREREGRRRREKKKKKMENRKEKRKENGRERERKGGRDSRRSWRRPRLHAHARRSGVARRSVVRDARHRKKRGPQQGLDIGMFGTGKAPEILGLGL